MGCERYTVYCSGKSSIVIYWKILYGVDLCFFDHMNIQLSFMSEFAAQN